MKKIKTICALILALLLAFPLAACGTDGPAAGSSSSALPTEEPNTTDVTVEMKVCTVDGTSICGAGLSEPYGEVYTFSCTPEQLTGADALLPGMIVEAVCDENVLETWPAQLQVHSVAVKEQETDYFSLYDQILKNLYTYNTDRNGKEQYFGFDLTAVETLSENEILLLTHNFATAHGAEPLQGTIQELIDEGYIDEEGLYWEDGVHFTLEEKFVMKDYVKFSVTKWKGGMCSIGYENTASLDANGQWVFAESSRFWVS